MPCNTAGTVAVLPCIAGSSLARSWSTWGPRTPSKQRRIDNSYSSLHCRVKFGAFLEYLGTAHAGRFDRIASGHYAGARRDAASGLATLHTTADAVKDQTYFLAHLSQVRS